MKNLLRKEFLLAVHPSQYIFMALASMIMIPNYPLYVSFFYPCLGLMYTFMADRENKDIFYTVLLPVKKTDTVKARCLSTVIIQLASIILSALFALIRNNVGVSPYIDGNSAGIEANVAFFGFVFIMFGIFNYIFFTSFYKTAYKTGVPFIIACSALFVFIVIAESLVHIPTPIKNFLDSTESDIMIKQIPILIGGIALWSVGWYLTYRKSAKNFAKVDL